VADTELRAAIAEAAQPDPNRAPARVAAAYGTLCDLDLLMSRFDEAISMGEKAVAILDTPDAPSPDLPAYLQRLAGAYRSSGKTNLGIPLLERALTIDLKLGPDDPKVSVDYDKLGSIYMEMGIIDEARASYQHALDTRISRLGPDQLDVATSWVNLGILEQRNSESPGMDAQARAARKDFETALAISEKNLGPESYGITGILDRLGKLFSDKKQYSDAEPVFQRSLAIREKLLGSKHSDVAPALENLALTYYFDAKYVEAEPLFQRALQVWTATQGEGSPLVARALDNLGALYSKQTRYQDAEPYFKKALAIRESQDVDSLSNLGLLYEAINDLKKADDYFQRAILIGDKGLGGDHPEVLDVMAEYSKMLKANGRALEAKKVDARMKELKDHLTPQITAGAVGASGASGGGAPPPGTPVRK